MTQLLLRMFESCHMNAIILILFSLLNVTVEQTERLKVADIFCNRHLF